MSGQVSRGSAGEYQADDRAGVARCRLWGHKSRTRMKRRSSKSLSAINVSVMTVSLSIYVDGKSPSTVDVDAVNSFPRPLCNILAVKEDEN